MPGGYQTPLSKIATQMVVEDGLRRDHLGRFADGPAWRMLLELYRRGDSFFKCIQIASLASHGTSQRLLNSMEAVGLIASRDDGNDRRRRVVFLTANGRVAVEQSLSEIEHGRAA